MEDLSKHLTRNKAFLHALTEINKKQIKHLIDHADRSQIQSIVEILFNILKGNVEINETIFSILLKNKSKLRKIIEKQAWVKRKLLLNKTHSIIVKILKLILPKIFE